MTDIGKVIKGFECCKDIHTAGPGYAQGCILCPYGETPSDGAGGYACFRAMVKDALALLKAQEAVVMVGVELTDAELIEEIRKAPIVLKPNVDAVPVVHGRWVKMTGMMPPEYHGHYECSECQWHMKGLRNSWTREEELNFCPNCGAKMDGGEA